MKVEIPAGTCMRLIQTTPLIFITTVHESGVVNGGAFGAYTNLSPSEIGIAIGKPSHTYQNIKRTGEFVVNVPGAELKDAVAIFGDNCPIDQSELDLAGLSATPARTVKPPYITECVAGVECRYVKEMEIGYHSFVVGKVCGGTIEEEFLDPDGYIDVVKARVMHDVKYPRPIYAVFGKYITGKD